MDLATGDPSRKRSAEKEFCFVRALIPSPWIQKYKVAPLIRKAHLDEFGIIFPFEGREGERQRILSENISGVCENLLGYIYTTKALFSSKHSAKYRSRLQTQL